MEGPGIAKSGAEATIVRQVAAVLKERGYAVEHGVGMSHFRCDLAVRRHGELQYRLGIMVDTEAHYQQPDLLEREMLRPQLLEGFGWSVAHVLTADWYRDRDAVVGRLVGLMEQEKAVAVISSDDGEAEDAWEEFDEPEECARAMASAQPPVAVETLSPTGAAGTQAAGKGGPFKRYFEFVSGSSSKFWEIALDGSKIIVRFGRIGSAGQTQTRLLVDDATATRAASRLIEEKHGKGYTEPAAGAPGSVSANLGG